MNDPAPTATAWPDQSVAGATTSPQTGTTAVPATADPETTASPDASVRATSTEGSTTTEGGPRLVVDGVEIDEGLRVVRVSTWIDGAEIDGGTCVTSLRSGADSLTLTTPGYFNVTRTECGPAEFDLGDVSSGTWSVTVTFEYDGLDLESAATEVRIP